MSRPAARRRASSRHLSDQLYFVDVRVLLGLIEEIADDFIDYGRRNGKGESLISIVCIFMIEFWENICSLNKFYYLLASSAIIRPR